MAKVKPKVKRMMFGGAAGALGGVKKAVAAKATPMLQQAKQMQAAKSAAQQAAPKQMQFMSDKLRGAPMQGAAKQVPAFAKPYADKQATAAALRRLPMNPPMPGKAGPKPMTGLGRAISGLGVAGMGAARGMMKKGGAVKKATKK